MKPNVFFDFIRIDEHAATPKYLQLSNAVIKAVELGKLKKGQLLPSINELSYEFEISRDTAEKGYKQLKNLGVIKSVPGKGYYIEHTDFKPRLKVLLLFNKLSAHKKIVYDAFIATLGNAAAVDFYIYNNDFMLFKHFLTNRKSDYSHFVILPHFIEGEASASAMINTLPKEKLILLDHHLPGIEGNYAAVCEDFEQNIYDALKLAKPHLLKYHTLKLIFPDGSYFPKEILKGFQRFCQQYAFSVKIGHDMRAEPIDKGEVFITLMEEDLVVLIERIIGLNYKVGKDVGVISYNETALKKIILEGITTISTDFRFMGETAAKLLMEDSSAHVEIPFYFTKRASL